MKSHSLTASCRHCNCTIQQRVLEYAIEHFNFALCISCQHWVEHKLNHTSRETIYLYLSLLKRAVPATLEQFDGNKAITIALADARINIAADDLKPGIAKKPVHFFNSLQTGTVHEKGYFTLTIAGTLVKDNLEQTADYITDLLAINKHIYRSC